MIAGSDYNGGLEMTLNPGTRLGPYEIIAALGTGGMDRGTSDDPAECGGRNAVTYNNPKWSGYLA
jgi:hypothetical protein